MFPAFASFVRYGVLRAARNAGLVVACLAASAFAQPGHAQITIAALGDSLTQGYGLPPEDGFVSQLNAWLDTAGADAEVINFGVSGDTTAGGLSRVDWTLTDDIDAVIVALGGNDILRGIDPAVSRANLKGILDKIAERGLPVLLIGMVAPANYGASFKNEFDGIYADLAESHGAILYPDFLGKISAVGDTSEALRLYMQPDAIHPNAAGVSLIVEDVGPSVQASIDPAEGAGS